MNKKFYSAPSFNEVHLTMTQVICEGTVQKVESNSGLKYGGGGSGQARTNERNNSQGNDAEWGNLW